MYMDGHLSHSPWLNHRCKIECLQILFYVFIPVSWKLISEWYGGILEPWKWGIQTGETP